MTRARVELVSTPTRYTDAMDGAERFARDVRKQGGLQSRRTMLRNAGTLLIALVAPLPLSGCPANAEEAERYILFLVEALQFVARAIKGDVKFSDPNERCRTYQLALDLFTATGYKDGAAVSNGLIRFDSCGEQGAVVPIEPARLLPTQAGNHLLQTIYDGQNWASDGFGVKQS